MVKYAHYDVVFQEIPDEVTLAINISNCPNRCMGCHSPSLMDDIGEELTEEVLISLISKYSSSITCICFMGGDSSVERIECLARFVRSAFNLKTAWYSGRDIFPNDTAVFDYIKLGGYVEVLGGLRSVTTNQRLYSKKGLDEWENITHRFWK